MKRNKTAAVVAGFAAFAFVGAPARAADVGSGKGILENSWNYVQYLFADGAASAASVASEANKAAAARSNVLGRGAARELQIQAEAQLQQRDFLGADKTLRRALSLAPELVSTQALLAVAIHGQGRVAEARTLLESLVKTVASSTSNANARAEAMTPVAAAFNGLGDPKRALQIYNEMLAVNADSAALHAGRGEALQRLDDDVAALASFQLASEVEPRFPNLELKRAQSLEKLGRQSEAENAYRVALQLDPTSAAALASVARLEGRRSAPVGALAVVASPVSTATATATATAAPAMLAATAPPAVQAAAAAPAKEAEPKNSQKKPGQEVAAASIAAADKAAAAPAPKPAADKAVSGEAQAAVLAQLGKWQAAWAGKEIDAYLGFYAKGFTPVKLNRAAWEADRRVKLNKPGTIQVNIVEPSFELDGGVLKVSFAQEYTSSNFRDKTRKRLDWVQDGGEWRIQRELTL